jgi:hypothetical protein
MVRRIRGWYGLTDCHGSQQTWTDDLPPDWDTLTTEQQDEYLSTVALDALYAVLDCGAEVVEDGS